jgi:hypothetical protein
MYESIFENIPPSSQALTTTLLAAQPKGKEELISALNQYATVIEQAAQQRDDLDVNLADCIGQSCITLLNENWDRAGDEVQQLIQLACEYYMEEEDGDGDLNSVYGFDDDALVLNAIAESIGRPDLSVTI